MAENDIPKAVPVGQVRAGILLIEFQDEGGRSVLGAVRSEDVSFDMTTIITATAGGILAARARHPDMTPAQLYDEETMPPDLREAHRLNDVAVCQAYDLPSDATEGQIVEHLMGMYKELGQQQQEGNARKNKIKQGGAPHEC